MIKKFAWAKVGDNECDHIQIEVECPNPCNDEVLNIHLYAAGVPVAPWNPYNHTCVKDSCANYSVNYNSANPTISHTLEAENGDYVVSFLGPCQPEIYFPPPPPPPLMMNVINDPLGGGALNANEVMVVVAIHKSFVNRNQNANVELFKYNVRDCKTQERSRQATLATGSKSPRSSERDADTTLNNPIDLGHYLLFTGVIEVENTDRFAISAKYNGRRIPGDSLLTWFLRCE